MSQSIFKKRVKVEISHNLGRSCNSKNSCCNRCWQKFREENHFCRKVIDEEKTHKAKVRFGKLDNFDVGVIRRIIHNLYRENISPSLKKILLQLKEKMNFPYSKTHLWRLLKKMGFGHEKWGRQRIISERPEIIEWRERYLRRIRKIREADPERAIVYTDETWLNQGHRTKKEWVDLETLKEKKT